MLHPAANAAPDDGDGDGDGHLFQTGQLIRNAKTPDKRAVLSRLGPRAGSQDASYCARRQAVGGMTKPAQKYAAISSPNRLLLIGGGAVVDHRQGGRRPSARPGWMS